MNISDLEKYSNLLLDYCLEVKEGSKLFVQSTTLAEPLLIQLYKGALQRKAIIEINLMLESQEYLYNTHGHADLMQWINPTYQKAVEEFDTYLYIRAPHLPGQSSVLEKSLSELRRRSTQPFQQLYNQRTGNRSLRRSLCQYPTAASAFDANMSLTEYEEFVLKSCFLRDPEPIHEWKKISSRQQSIVDYLNQITTIRYINPKTDISFSVKGRIWINSDGRTNMPSGEIYTSPIEDSIHGHIYFDYPFLYNQQTIQGVSLKVKEGKVTEAIAEIGNDYLEEMLLIPGANHFGEVAIGMNENISIPTKNILFDEKMAGSVHMALGQSYLQCGGKNESTLHQDMVADMSEGEIWADGEKIYENGFVLI